ncbi:MAG: Bro-N domain-containing protein [Bacteroidales bacterium]|nr:Bro-N domain-containing protein [Bacteroidales bacterium]
MNNQIAIFRGKTVRKTIYKKEWWFSVADVIEILTDTVDIRDYIKKMKKRDKELNTYWGTNCHLLKMITKDCKKRKITSANTEGIFRIIQSIPSPKAEPFKRWLAKVGYERIQEIENPESATKRTRMLYKLKGYSNDWIEKRMRGIAIREELTDEWKNRGAKRQKDYEILTAEISKATFGLIPSEYKKLKGLKRENLRDHMNDLEIILTMLGERTTTEIHRTRNSQGLPKLKDDSRVGGQIAGTARKQIERKTRQSIISKENFLPNKNKKKIKSL